MRALVVLLASMLIPVTAEPFWWVLLDTMDANGRHVQFRYEAEALWKKPQWAAGGKGPPLSIETATKIAYDAALRESPKASGVSFGDIKLLRNACDYSRGRVVTWFWDFSVSPVINIDGDPARGIASVEPARDIVILLDGEVVRPTPVK
jgi:hypothetical protein